ncbi:MAG: thiamine pyrophosphate-dependent dehydrogenase E1 component subunit alpha [Chloroflexi bacterium]|nr:thiamine pyrophosphate-dependent dehydrogenase E1 component subunit alpha [Chloroflexota bacterium]
MKQASVLDRRSFVKALLAAGATSVVASCRSAPAGDTPSAPAGGKIDAPSWIHPASLIRPLPGPGGNLAWKAGDTLKWLTPEKIAPGKPADLLASLPKEKLADMYHKLWVIRLWETAVKDLSVTGKDGLYGVVHLYVGQEAMAVGSIAALNPDDYITSTHRGHGHVIARGTDINKMMAEMFMKATGSNKAYGGSMHICDESKGVLSANPIVGAGAYIGAGAAYNMKVRGSKQVVMTFLGDGATNSPYYFSALRQATMYKCPLVVVVENNFQNMWISMATVSPTPWCADLTVGLGIPSVVVDGNDIAAMYAATKEAAERARAGEGPSVVEGITYRWLDHDGFAGAKERVDGAFNLPYRTDDEVRQWIARDPIKRFHSFLVEKKLFTDADLKAAEAGARKAVDDSIDFARKSPLPAPEDGVKNVWSLGPLPATQFGKG